MTGQVRRSNRKRTIRILCSSITMTDKSTKVSTNTSSLSKTKGKRCRRGTFAQWWTSHKVRKTSGRYSQKRISVTLSIINSSCQNSANNTMNHSLSLKTRNYSSKWQSLTRKLAAHQSQMRARLQQRNQVRSIPAQQMTDYQLSMERTSKRVTTLAIKVLITSWFQVKDLKWTTQMQIMEVLMSTLTSIITRTCLTRFSVVGKR